MTAWTAQLDDVILAPGRFLEFGLSGDDQPSPLPPLAVGDTFKLPFRGAVLSGSVKRIKGDTAVIAIEGAQYRIKRGAQRWRIAEKIN